MAVRRNQEPVERASRGRLGSSLRRALVRPSVFNEHGQNLKIRRQAKAGEGRAEQGKFEAGLDGANQI